MQTIVNFAGFEEWRDFTRGTIRKHKDGIWRIGDLLIQGKEKYPDRYQEAIDCDAYAVSTAGFALWLCEKFPPELRSDAIALRTFKEIGCIKDPELREQVRVQAIEGRWTSEEAKAKRQELQPPTKKPVDASIHNPATDEQQDFQVDKSLSRELRVAAFLAYIRPNLTTENEYKECDWLIQQMAAVKPKPSGKFVPPTKEEAQEYGATIQLPISQCVQFVDWFASNGWKVGGKAAMKDWQAAMRNWHRNWVEKRPQTDKPATNKPLEGVDYVLKEIDDRVVKCTIGTTTPFNESAWYDAREAAI